MSTSRFGVSFAVLAMGLVAFGAPGWAQDEGTTIQFYGAPDAGPAPTEVHFHPIGEESFINSVTKWAWDFGDGGTSDESYTSHEYASDGTYTVKLTVTLPGGETQTATRADYIRIAPGAKPTEDEEEAVVETVVEQSESPAPVESDTTSQDEADDRGGANGLVFIHHSCGENWLNSGLHRALLAKPYIDDRNDITYGTELNPDPGRPRSLGSPAGDLTDMQHWILWFNDYLGRVQTQGGRNRIIMFKSCFPNSHVDDVGTEPGDPFSDWHCIANYKAVYRHPGGAGKTYTHDGHTYRALQDVFAQHPDTLFVAVTAPPECWTETDKAVAANARAFNTWLTEEWLPGYVRATGLHNVAVFDWFDLLACPSSDAAHPNQLRGDYGGGAGDSHPNNTANTRSTQAFVSFLDQAWNAFQR